MADDKIYDDELMTNEELDKVAGGTYQETAEDSEFLWCYGLCNKYSEGTISITAGMRTNRSDEVKAGWAKVGIEYEYHGGTGLFAKSNKYYMNGKEISRQDAARHVMNIYGEDPLTYAFHHK